MEAQNCKNCVHAGAVRDGHRTLWICSRTPEAKGGTVRVPARGLCNRFRQRPAATMRAEAADGPADKDVRYIPLTKGKVAVVDAGDYGWLSLHTWYAMSPGGRYYAARRRHDKLIAMHREIMVPVDGYVVDHIDGDGLNNRRSNLRICTRQQNYCNRAKSPGRTSIYKGVSYHKMSGKYIASIRSCGERRYLGIYDSEVEAARAYDRAAVELHGEFAWLNFPEEWGRPPHWRRDDSA